MGDDAPGSSVEFAELSRSIANRFPTLSRELQRSARYLVDHPDDVALFSMRRAAASAGVQPATMLRLARRLDFDGYPALRQVFVERLRRRTTSYSRRALELQGRGSGDQAERVVRETVAAHLRNLQAGLDRNGAARFHACAEALDEARATYVLGLRSCFPLAFFFHYVYRLFRDDGVLLDGRGGAFPDDLRGISRRDVLFAISLAPYTRDTVKAVEFAASRGATVLALTDSPVSPLARRARHALLFAPDTPSFFHSVTAAMSIVETLLALLVARGGDRAVAAISESEAQLASFAAYWREPRARRAAR